MPTQYPQKIPQGAMQFLNNQRRTPKGSPQMAPVSSRPKKTQNKKLANATRTGDAVSDDSDDGDDEGASGADDDDDDDLDEPDGFALSGTPRIGNGVASRLAGLSPVDADMLDLDDDAVAGAEDDDYGAVDDMSDGDNSVSDGHEKDVLRSAEKDLIAEFERTENPRKTNAVANEIHDLSLTDAAALERRESLQSEESQIYDDLELDLDVNLDFNEDPFRGLRANDTLYQEMVGDAEGILNSDLGLWRQLDTANEESREGSLPSSLAQKKVRFHEAPLSRSSSMSSEEDPREAYPDLFDGHDDPILRQQMMMTESGLDAIPDNESVYDFEDEYERVAFEVDEQDSDSDSGSDFSVSSSEDEGDTTDEEDPEELVARVKALRNTTANASTPASTPTSAPSTPVNGKRATPKLKRANTAIGRMTTPKNKDGRPRMGTFERDPTKARVEADIQGSGVKVTCPTNPPAKDRAYWERARKAINSRDVSPNGSITCVRSTPRTASIPQRPFTARSTLGTMFDGNLDFLRSNDENNIAEDILSAGRKAPRASFTSTSEAHDSDLDFDSSINMDDFVQMSDSESDVGEPDSAGIMSPTSEAFDGDFDGGMASSNHNLLGHLHQSRGLVSSFRNNQVHARHVSSLAANPAKRAQTSEANALQKGRRAAANTPMTPARKKLAHQDITGAGVKKPASPLVQKHRRRSRGSSLSGMQQTLALDHFAGGNAN